MTDETRHARKCINCHCIYGCSDTGGIRRECVTCAVNQRCTIICVSAVSGGACASCIEVYKLKKMLGKED